MKHLSWGTQTSDNSLCCDDAQEWRQEVILYVVTHISYVVLKVIKPAQQLVPFLTSTKASIQENSLSKCVEDSELALVARQWKCCFNLCHNTV